MDLTVVGYSGFSKIRRGYDSEPVAVLGMGFAKRPGLAHPNFTILSWAQWVGYNLQECKKPQESAKMCVPVLKCHQLKGGFAP